MFRKPRALSRFVVCCCVLFVGTLGEVWAQNPRFAGTPAEEAALVNRDRRELVKLRECSCDSQIEPTELCWALFYGVFSS